VKVSRRNKTCSLIAAVYRKSSVAREGWIFPLFVAKIDLLNSAEWRVNSSLRSGLVAGLHDEIFKIWP
jgi:hypothetical protein